MITLSNLSFRYGRRGTALRALDLALDEFPLVVLGPNGAGKSTLLSILVGARQPSKGTVLFSEGSRLSSEGTPLNSRRRMTGWLPQDVQVSPRFSCEEWVSYAGWLKGMSRPDARKSAVRILTELGLDEYRKTNSTALSGGQRRRLGLAQALVHSPNYLILDEPHSGLDPEQRANVREALAAIAVETKIVVSTHQTDDLVSAYAQVLVINEGSVLFYGSVEEFCSHAAPGSSVESVAESAYRRILDQARTRAA